MLQKFTLALIPTLIFTIGIPQNTFAATTSYLEDIKSFNHSWTANALKLQREIDINAPLNEATFLATHNSYNASAYQIPVIRYIDPNQTLSLYDQLEMGVRSIELDAHWTLTKYFNRDILLCHAQSNHIGCSVFDRNFTEGLEEVRDWLKANPNEVVLLYIERHLDGHEPRLAAELNDYLGAYIYKPSTVRKENAEAGSCVSIPNTLTKAEILKAGKQLLIVAKGCDGPNPGYSETDKYPEAWNDYAFSGIGNIPEQQHTFLEAMIGDLTNYPDCGKSTAFKFDPNHTTMWRVYEDRTLLTDILHRDKKIFAEDMQELVRCGINWQTMDRLSVADTRLTAAIWSWAPEYPKGNGQCAIYKADEGMMNVTCNQLVTAFACQNNQTREMKAVMFGGGFMYGESACQFSGKDWHFATPVNGFQMTKLKESMAEMGLSEIWLNYVMDAHQNWRANLGA